ncbi:MAG: BTAD domain-containing putative transcriptional regulator [Acidimicrobiales bacterium]
MAAPSALRIRLFGGLDVEGVSPTDLGSRKARTLVKVLALARGAVAPTGVVLEALWPGDAAPAQPVEQAGVLVSRLRKTLGSDRLLRTEAGWALKIDWLDVAELEARGAEAVERLDAGQYASARTAARAALDVVRGPLLPDDEGPWVEGPRAACERLGGRLRLVLAEAALATGDRATAAVEGERALDVDPYDEAALRVAMRAHAAAGRPASALNLYARTRIRLADELGVSPTRRTEAVHDEVLLAEERPAIANPPTSLFGRAPELARLELAAQRVDRQGAWSLEVVGDAGIGKTALLDVWAATTPRTVLRGRCDQLGRELPLQPVLDALGADDLGLGETEAGVTSVVDPVVGQTALFANLVRRFDDLVGPSGGALVLDDVQWADPLTLAFCRALRRRGTRCLIAAACRTGAGVDIAADERVDLGPLALDAVAQLVGAARAVPLLQRSGGNPLFLLHLAASDGTDLPDSVRDAVSAQVEALGSDLAATIRAAAVLGTEIDLDFLASVLRIPAVDLLGHIDVGVASGLLADRGGLVLSHALVRDALEAGTTPSHLAWLHRQAAVELAARPGADELAIARHAQAGGDRALASRSLVRAAVRRSPASTSREARTCSIGPSRRRLCHRPPRPSTCASPALRWRPPVTTPGPPSASAPGPRVRGGWVDRLLRARLRARLPVRRRGCRPSGRGRCEGELPRPRRPGPPLAGGPHRGGGRPGRGAAHRAGRRPRVGAGLARRRPQPPEPADRRPRPRTAGSAGTRGHRPSFRRRCTGASPW